MALASVPCRRNVVWGCHFNDGMHDESHAVPRHRFNIVSPHAKAAKLSGREEAHDDIHSVARATLRCCERLCVSFASLTSEDED